MIDLLDGIFNECLSIIGLELDDNWAKMSDGDKQTVITNFESMVKANSEALAKEIEDSPALKAINDNIEFTSKYLAGEIKPVDKEGNIVGEKKETATEEK